jgi:hypothetical protein
VQAPRYLPLSALAAAIQQAYPSKNNTKSPLVYNDDGSTDLYFGPRPPRGKESNWIQTVSGKGLYVLIRL